jgi:hypothetical protein
MISYNWGNQQSVLRIAKSLKERGYHIWLDVEQMTGSTLEASIPQKVIKMIMKHKINIDLFKVATAVEQADMILMCMSQKYKDSPNCRLEGEYCMNRRISFVPLMMQEGYKPDGWYDSLTHSHSHSPLSLRPSPLVLFLLPPSLSLPLLPLSLPLSLSLSPLSSLSLYVFKSCIHI